MNQRNREQINHAATKDEALKMSITAAESLMKAMRLSQDPSERKELKSQCAVIMDTADRIKKDDNWQPSLGQSQTSPKNNKIGQWATDVALTTRSSLGPHVYVSPHSSFDDGCSSTTAAEVAARNPLSNVSSQTRIRRLLEPVSTRSRSTREGIILLKASLVNGFKCPPWTSNPTSTEFTRQTDDELFT